MYSVNSIVCGIIMKSSILLSLLLLGLANSAPISNDDKLVINEEFFPDELKIYEGQHEIVKIYVPLNKINFDDNDDDTDSEVTLFFVEADVKPNERVDQGLYVKKGSVVKKLLDNGRDIAAPLDDEDSLEAYFAAKDGIYSYDAGNNAAVKYGNIDEDLIGIVMKDSNSMYVLSADKKVYKVSEDGNKKERVSDIKNAEQIVIDFVKNIYYVDSDKKLYMVNTDGVKQIAGLPETVSKISLIRPPFIFDDGGLPVVINGDAYFLHANGTLEKEDIEINTDISAYAMEAALVQYFAKDKKIYEYNILALLLGTILEELKEFLETKSTANEIQQMAGRPRKSAIRDHS